MNFIKSNKKALEYLKESVSIEDDFSMHQLFCSWYNLELVGAYGYNQLSSTAKKLSLDGTAYYFHEKWEEELEHSEKVKEMILNKWGEIEYFSIDLIEYQVDTIDDYAELFQVAYKLEKTVSDSIDMIMNEVKNTSYHMLDKFVSEFLDEQIEEEASAIKYIELARQAAFEKNILFLDCKLGKKDD